GSDRPFEIVPELAAKGRQLFATLGCASCHQLKDDNKVIASELKAKPFSKLSASGGCLSAEAVRGLPFFRLTPLQRLAASAAVTAVSNATEPPSDADVVAHALLSFNCYACHERAQLGGVEPIRNAFFETLIPEMGDEGRIPPALDGVGDK